MSNSEAIPGRRGVLANDFAPGDIAFLFRTQYNRSLDEIDQLLQR
jgi:hypothetical protein